MNAMIQFCDKMNENQNYAIFQNIKRFSFYFDFVFWYVYRHKINKPDLKLIRKGKITTIDSCKQKNQMKKTIITAEVSKSVVQNSSSLILVLSYE